ncbi:Hsp20/alpha crystallin family protein [Bacillus aquiflavi]|uniref:Hsp20/alpha crystallin family protein n=1 Tax=Bacillus aquiflavi TaxID=2672567 RepID=A0A6B3VVZ5_9BACI|nr:Hsp20/alpha crystallin family protein [Bacillus aquiflavi]MBA4537973.1 Hsp20/alpha crystallin family protein [Bacillus aquiflavi]NEY82229.1 Hsp20/alpha crystallin family protein [Bacillus aquiflavi]UAC49874.1 Hsp20/alpha crystallin family protein [Bacillus aquiflavi]
MDIEKLKQWLDITKQYQTEHFWKQIFESELGKSASQSRDNPFDQNYSAYFSQQDAFPLIDMYEEGNCIFIEVELPGLKTSDIYITLEEKSLIIKGEYKTLKPNIRYLLKERPNRKFEKKLAISSKIKKEMIQSVLRNGILVISLPIEEQQSEAIPITIDESESES